MGSVKDKAFELFDAMQPGEVVVISKIAKKDPAAFKEYAKEYIDQGGMIEFNNDYRKLRRLNVI